MTTHHVHVTDPATSAETLIEHGAALATLAELARDAGDHSAAGVYRERERSTMRLASARLNLSMADSLASIADSLSTLALDR